MTKSIWETNPFKKADKTLLEDYFNAIKSGKSGEEFCQQIAKELRLISAKQVRNRVYYLKKLKGLPGKSYWVSTLQTHLSKEGIEFQISRIEKVLKRTTILRGDWPNLLSNIKTIIKQNKELSYLTERMNSLDKQTMINISEKNEIKETNNQLGQLYNKYLIDENNQMLEIMNTLWNLLDPDKFAAFCDKQLKLRMQYKLEETSLIGIHKVIASLLHTSPAAVQSKYYDAKRNKIKKQEKEKHYRFLTEQNKKLTERIKDLENIISLDEAKISRLDNENKRLCEEKEEYRDKYEFANQTIQLIKEDLDKIKKNPIGKLLFKIKHIN